jgi:hypothetical protein
MSESTTTAASVNAEVATEQRLPAFQALPWWAAATPEQRTAIIADHIRSGLPVEDYTQAAAQFGSAAELLLEVESPEGTTLAQHPVATAEPKSPDAAEPSPAAAQAPGAEVAAGAAQVAEAAEAAEEQARAEAKATLKAAVKAYRQGERALKAGFLEAGHLADVYVHQRLTLGDKRDAAVRQVELALSEHSSDRVEPNRLIACYHAYRLLALEPEVKADAVPYGHYRDAWVQLVLRVEEGKPSEHWTLLPGSEEACKAAFATAVKDGLSKAACQDKAKAVVAEHVRKRAEATEAEAAAKRREAVAKAAELTTSRQMAEEAARKEEQARKAAEQAAREEDKAALTAIANAALEEKRAAEKAHAADVEQAIAAEREKARAEATAAEAKRLADAAAEKARKAAEKANKPPAAAKNVPAATSAPAGETPALPQRPQPQAAPVSKQIAAALAQDAGLTLAEAIAGHETPDDVLAFMLRALHGKYAKSLSKPALRVVEAALIQLDREEKRALSPAQLVKTQSPAPGTVVEKAAEPIPA